MTRFLLNLIMSLAVILPMLQVENKPFFLTFEGFEEGERIAYDFRMRASIAKGNVIPDSKIAIIDIDQDSIEEIGYWPWTRDKLADFINILANFYEVELIVLLDNFLRQSDQTERVLKEIKDRFYYDEAMIQAVDQIAPEFNYDQLLSNEIEGRPIMLGYEFSSTGRQLGDLPVDIQYFTAAGRTIQRSEMRPLTIDWIDFKGFTANDELFLSRALGSGFNNLKIDDDGAVRSYYLLATYAKTPYPSIPLEVLRFVEDVGQSEDLRLLGSSGQEDEPSSWRRAEKVGVRGSYANLARDGSVLLNFPGTGGPSGSTFNYFSARNVNNSSVPKNELEGKVVFIGSSSELLNDLWNTPVNTRMPGVELHALALKNIIEDTGLVRPANAWIYEALALFLLAFTFSWLYPKLKLTFSLVITAGTLFLTYYLNYNILWIEHMEYYRILPFMLLIVALMLINLMMGLIVEYQQKQKVEGVLNQYIPPELAKEVNTSKKGFSMEGEIRQMSVLFSDVRGFTSISERLKPSELTSLMNQMLTALSRQIHVNRGTIDKYIGDAVMAFWNAPLDDPNHAANAVRGAIGMQSAMATLSKELVAKGMPELKMGVGINTGEACVGNMGSEIRLSYTVMGDTVNLASRLEGITKQYGVSIIVGDETYNQTKDDFIYRPVDSVRVKGKETAVNIYEPICAKRNATPEIYNLQDLTYQYFEYYKTRRFEEMVAIIQSLLQTYPTDGLLRLYLERATHFMSVPPPDDWEGVTNFEVK